MPNLISNAATLSPRKHSELDNSSFCNESGFANEPYSKSPKNSRLSPSKEDTGRSAVTRFTANAFFINAYCSITTCPVGSLYAFTVIVCGTQSAFVNCFNASKCVNSYTGITSTSKSFPEILVTLISCNTV